ncbi:hypothetical protein PAXINDRAFT_21136 [Paxillus involutus ATCC 200175]|uniref:Uncharacterized protein n=1 Tax=Paxillus involutus ATCC 200175 TaxID=664439 RepID=A0A0C9TEJ7_PAXIN|nr:hypothetical protein PAXINDRAFT_21136 [Paxillus involutus ATCC 200175]
MDDSVDPVGMFTFDVHMQPALFNGLGKERYCDNLTPSQLGVPESPARGETITRHIPDCIASLDSTSRLEPPNLTGIS